MNTVRSRTRRACEGRVLICPFSTGGSGPIAMRKIALPLCLSLIASLQLAGCGGDDATKSLESAKTYLSKKENAAAVIQLKNALQKDPNLAEARFLLGQALLQGGDPASSVTELRRAAELRYPEASVTPVLVKALMAEHQAGVVLEKYGRVELSDPLAKAELKTSIAAIYAAQGKVEDSRAALSVALAAIPDFPAARVLQARLLARESKYDESLNVIDSVLKKSPDDLDAMEFQGEIYLYGKHDPKEAVAAYAKALRANPSYVPARIGLITLLLAQNDLKAAAAEIERLRKQAPRLVQTAYFEAQLAFLTHDLGTANKLAQQLVRALPDSAKVLQLAGAIQFEMKSLLEAERSLSKALQIEPNLPVARRLLARTYLQMAQPDKALSVVQPLLAADSPDPEAIKLTAEANLQTGDFAKAQSNFARAVTLNPNDIRSRVALEVGKAASGDFAAAIAGLQKIAESDSGSAADIALIELHLKRNQLDRAAAAARHLEAKQPGKPVASNVLGRIFVLQKNNVEARRSFERALRLDPAYFPAVANLASLDVAENHLDAAKKRFDDLLLLQPKNVDALLAVAGLRARGGAKPEEVIGLLENAVKLNPGDVAPRLVLIERLLSQRDAKAALAAAQEAVSAFPDNARAQEALGDAQFASGDSNQALRSFAALAAMEPASPAAHMRVAQVNLATKNFVSAKDSLRKALAVQPTFLPAQQALVDIALSEKRFDDALAVAKSIQTQRPNESTGFILQGQIEVAGGNLPGAEETYRAALKRFPSTDPAVKLHSVLVASGKDAEADKLAASWSNSHPNDMVFASYLGDLALAKHEFSRAETQFRKVLAGTPNNAAILNNLAWVMIQQKNPKALETVEKATALQPNVASFWDTQASAYLAADRAADALQSQKKAVALAPANAVLRLNLAKILLKTGDKPGARAELEALKSGEGEPSQQAEANRLLLSL